MITAEINPFDQLDSYDLRHYIEHLIDAGQSADVHKVLNQETRYDASQGVNWINRIFRNQSTDEKGFIPRNGWYSAQERIGEISNFIKDVRLCWNAAENETKKSLEEKQPASSIALEARYALISTCLNNIAGNMPPALISRLLGENLLTTDQALILVDQVPELPERALATAIIAFHTENEVRDDIFDRLFEILKSINEEISLAKILGEIAIAVPEVTIRLKLVEIANNIQYSKSRAEALISLIPLLSENRQTEVIETALEAAHKIQNENDRAIILIRISGYLAEPQKSETLHSALEIIASLKETAREYSQSEALQYFIEEAPENLLTPVIEIFNSLSNEQYRARIQLAFASRFFIEGNTNAALKIFNQFVSPLFIPYLSYALTKVIPQVTPTVAPDLLKIALKISSESYSDGPLIQLIPSLPKTSLKSVLKAVRKMHSADIKTRALASLAKRTADFSDHSLLVEALNAVLQENVSNAARNEAIQSLGEYLTKDDLRKIFSTIQRINDDAQQILTVLALTHHLPPEKRINILEEEISRAQSIVGDEPRGEIEIELVTHFAKINKLATALKMAFKIRHSVWRAKALAKIFAHTPQILKPDIYRQIINHWKRDVKVHASTNELLKNLAPHLAPGFVLEAIEIIRSLDPLHRPRAYTDLIPFVPLNVLREVIIPVLENIRTDPNINDFSRDFDVQRLSIAAAERFGALGLEDEALIMAESITHEISRFNAFEKIIPYLSVKNLLRVRGEAAKYEGRREWIDRHLARRFAALGENEKVKILINDIKDPSQRATACAEMAKDSNLRLRSLAIDHALELVKLTQEHSPFSGDVLWQAKVFAELTPYLTYEDLQAGWQIALRLNSDDDRRIVISTLTAKLLEYEPSRLYPFWHLALYVLSKRSRKNFLIDLQTLAEFIDILGGTEAVEETIQAIRQVGRWW